MFGGSKATCLVDSGATNNFISRSRAEKYGLAMINGDGITVRLADGQTVVTTAHTIATIKVGELWLETRFEVLE